MAGSQRGAPGKRPSMPPLGVASSPASTPTHMRAHHAHFRCFPRHVAGDHSYHSEPDPRGMSILMERPLVKLHWQEGRSGHSRVVTTVMSPSYHAACVSPDDSYGPPMITSEAMVTTGSQTSARDPTKLYDMQTMPSKRHRLMDLGEGTSLGSLY
ncbi:hypothetical protein J6590_076132 [Homalodisca vitripennis]|nr:hypothetical protein J6590_076132 [Homalodisca vitripennis]